MSGGWFGGSRSRGWLLACGLLCVHCSPAEARSYTVRVTNRSLTGRPLLAFPTSSWAPNTLNAAWLPLPGRPGGGLFFRALQAPNATSYDTIGFVPALDDSGLRYPRASPAYLLKDGPDSTVQTAGADPRATSRPASGEGFVTYQTSGPAYPGRHSYISRSARPADLASWRRHSAPMFAGLQTVDGQPFLRATTLTSCNGSGLGWLLPTEGHAGSVRHKATGLCLALRPQPGDSDQTVGLAQCGPEATQWRYTNATGQLVGDSSVCLDVDRGDGPRVGFWACHGPGDRDLSHQQFSLRAGPDGQSVQLLSRSARGAECVTVRETVPNDCGTALWFKDDGPDAAERAYAVATFGELRGGNLSLVSSADLHAWRYEGLLLETRPKMWDNATLSAGPAPVRLRDGNWLLLYNVDQLWPVNNPAPLPSWGRCALGWAVLDQANVTRVLARAKIPLVTAELPWELDGFTPRVVYTDGIRPEGGDVFTVFSGAGDSVVEAFRIVVDYQ